MSEQDIQHIKPVFYQDPMMLSREAHKDLKLTQATSFSFAQNVATVPLVVSELAIASAHYPIVFVHGTEPNGERAAQPMPMALLSLTKEQNDFVDDEGQWRANTYIPAYVRRYPFVFASETETDNLVLCADLASDRFSESDGEPLFTEGEPTEMTSRILSFCNDFQRDYATTAQLSALLEEHELLVDQRLTITRAGKSTIVLDGLKLIDREKFRSLEDDAFLKLRRAGALGAIYAHLSSLHRLRQLA